MTEPETTVGQEPTAPVEAPAVTAQAPATQEPDYSTIRVRVGDGPDAEMSVADLTKSYAESRRAMAKAQQEKAEMSKRYEWADTFAKDIQAKPGLRQHLEAYYAGQNEDAGQNYAAGVVPTRESIELAELKTKVASFTLNTNFENLDRDLKEKYGVPLTDEQKAALWEDVALTNSEDVKALYWARFGETVVEKATKKTTQQVAAKIADNATAYRGPTNLAPGAITPSAPAMFSEEWNNLVLADIAKVSK